jgi:hypothetical protein
MHVNTYEVHTHQDMSIYATKFYITRRRQRTHVNKHPRTQTATQTHSQAPMPANESLFTDVMPLEPRSSVPAWVGQEPERSSGAPS